MQDSFFSEYDFKPKGGANNTAASGQTVSLNLGRAGKCLQSKLATERSGVCLHPAVGINDFLKNGRGNPSPTEL